MRGGAISQIPIRIHSPTDFTDYTDFFWLQKDLYNL